MDQELNLQEWKLPSVPTKNIYKQSTFSNLSFLSDYTIKTVERTVSLNKEYETNKLFSKDSIDQDKQKYSFIHIGLVQVAVKPLTRQGLNNSVLLCLRDGRHLRFKDSLLGSIESSLYEGPVYFNCYPNFSLSLFDPTLLHALELNVKTDGYSMMKNALPLNIVYRIYYKLMKTTLEPQAKDGTIGLNFQPYRKSKSYSRASGLRVPTSYNEIIDKLVSPPRYNLSQLETNLQGINKGKFVDTHFYSVASAASEMNNPIRNYNPNSPTQSQMEDPQIMVIIKDYELNKNYKINKEKLRKNFMSPEYDDKREWFFNKFSKYLQNQIRTKWYNHMNELGTDIYFFPWFEQNYTKIDINKVNTVSRAKNNWIKVQNNEVVHEEYLPYESIALSHRGSQIIASPIKKVSLSDDNKNMNNIIQQNNFTNTYIKVLGDKLERIENQINSFTIKNQEKEIERPLFIPYETPPNLQFSFKKDNTELLEEISKIKNQENKNHVSTTNYNNEIL